MSTHKTGAIPKAKPSQPSTEPASINPPIVENIQCFNTSLRTLRSPISTSKAQAVTSCQLCTLPDSDEMVACDMCNKWFHFHCVNVNSSIADVEWCCAMCKNTEYDLPTQPANNLNVDNISVRSRGSSHSSTHSRKAQLELQMLEERRAMQKQRMLEQECRDEQYLKEKHRILQSLDEAEVEDRCSVDFTKDTQHWVNNQMLIKRSNQASVPCSSTIPTTQYRIPTYSNPVPPQTRPCNLPQVVTSGTQQVQVSKEAKTPATNMMPCKVTSAYTTSLPTAYANQSSILPSQYTNLQLSSGASQPMPSVSVQNTQGNQLDSRILTANHLAARQVLPRDLPNFSGNVEEWPLFISTYESSTNICGFSNEENLIRLQRSLKGKALEAVSCRLFMSSMVPETIATLRMLFGRPEVIIHSLLEGIRKNPPIKSDNLEHVIKFSLSVQNLCATMEASGLQDHLCNPSLMQELVDKLPCQIKLNWAMHRQTIQSANLATFGNWLFNVAQAASSVTMPSSSSYSFSDRSRSFKTKSFLNIHDNNITTDESEPENLTSYVDCPVCGEENHHVADCKEFKQLSRSNKWTVVTRYRLCRRCLCVHRESQCSTFRECGTNGCTLLHHPLLHNNKKKVNNNMQRNISISPPSPFLDHFSNNTHQSNQSVMFRIVPIKLYNNDITIDTYAFIDEGSSLTLLEESIADELKLQGSPEGLCLRWTADATRLEPNSRRISLQISGQHQQARKYNMTDVRTVNKLNLPVQSINLDSLILKYSHLINLPIQNYQNAVPRILIGLDNGRIGLPLEVIEGRSNEPVATRTRLGWIVHGYVGGSKLQDVKDGHQHYNYHICDCNKDLKLHKMVKEFFSLENFGVKKPEMILESTEETRAKQILHSTTLRRNKHFETGLLWRFDDISFPDSLPMAKRRLLCLERKMARDPQLAESLKMLMRDYITKGYARKLTQNELAVESPRIWYLPIFSVTNHNKPGKVRLVWDAAAEVDNISLNSMLLKGPDQLSPLPGVLQRFRERKIAICGDISEMFHQVHVIAEDQNSQRFIWRENSDEQYSVYAMNVMTFGATCSPSSAQYVKNKNASDYADRFPRAALAIHENHYVDDFLDSVNTTEEAIQLAKEVRFIHSEAGFHIRNWISNSRSFLEAIGETGDKNVKNLNICMETAAEKVLGMWWFPDSDTFSYSLQYSIISKEVMYGKRRPTKREVLRTLMSIYDPLGFIAFFLVFVKILLQEIWRTCIGWDEPLNDNLFEKWSTWIQLLPMVDRVRVPRCYLKKINPDQIKSTQLHVFVDASENAYAAVAYLRFESETIVECALVAAKTKVAPQKPLTIPRLELQAATLGARLANSICKSHSIIIDQRYIWSDSKTVLSWLRSDQRKYRQFVAFRVGEILETTELSEWRWIPTMFNVADEATKWQEKPTFNVDNRWFSGPDFLYQSGDHWPKDPATSPSTDIEMRSNVMCTHSIQKLTSKIDVSRFSKWSRLYRTQAYVLRFVNNLLTVVKKNAKNEVDKGPFSSSELNLAQNMLYRQAQEESFLEEIQILIHNKDVPTAEKQNLHKSSPIYSYSPYLDDSNVLRVRGRIDAANCVDESTKRPILLPRKHPITLLIVDSYHRKFNHHNQETIVNELRQKYCIPCVRVVVKNVKYLCQLCKIKSAKPKPPEMGELPRARLSSFIRPFSYVGVDYFGPMFVTVGRRREKRWGVLFTCMTIRAIHIEIAHSLTTDSCIMCVRNFIARRGTPLEFHSDNGTNFHGANNELAKELREFMQNDKLKEEFTSANSKWIFNPPASPHMGGSWERLVASVKKGLLQIMPERYPRDEVLHNLMLEVESIINSRPLTYVSIEQEGDEALTPNHFLLGSSNGSKPPCRTCNKDLLSRNWKTAQYLTNAFWKRWVREYLPTITRRTKWFDKVKPIEKDDIVVIVDDSLPRNSWPMGKVLDTILGKDGEVRSALVQTKSGIYHRPSVKIAVLDVQNKRKEIKQSSQDNLPGDNVVC